MFQRIHHLIFHIIQSLSFYGYIKHRFCCVAMAKSDLVVYKTNRILCRKQTFGRVAFIRVEMRLILTKQPVLVSPALIRNFYIRFTTALHIHVNDRMEYISPNLNDAFFFAGGNFNASVFEFQLLAEVSRFERIRGQVYLYPASFQKTVIGVECAAT